MKRSALVVFLLVFLSLLISCSATYAFAIRCSTDLIQEGDTKFEVTMTLKKCGTVLEKEILRSEDTNQKREIWLIRVLEMGGHYCYQLTFVDAVLEERKLLGKCD